MLHEHALDVYRRTLLRHGRGAIQLRLVVGVELEKYVTLLDPLPLLLQQEHAGAFVRGRAAGLHNGHHLLVAHGMDVSTLGRPDLGLVLPGDEVGGFQVPAPPLGGHDFQELPVSGTGLQQLLGLLETATEPAHFEDYACTFAGLLHHACRMLVALQDADALPRLEDRPDGAADRLVGVGDGALDVDAELLAQVHEVAGIPSGLLDGGHLRTLPSGDVHEKVLRAYG